MIRPITATLNSKNTRSFSKLSHIEERTRLSDTASPAATQPPQHGVLRYRPGDAAAGPRGRYRASVHNFPFLKRTAFFGFLRYFEPFLFNVSKRTYWIVSANLSAKSSQRQIHAAESKPPASCFEVLVRSMERRRYQELQPRHYLPFPRHPSFWQSFSRQPS